MMMVLVMVVERDKGAANQFNSFVKWKMGLIMSECW